MSENFFLSIVVIYYFNPEYIYTCLHSIASQGVDGIELVVIDDASPDSACERAVESIRDVAKEFGARVVYHKKKVNEGRGAARRTGFELSTGTFVAFIDGDDCVSPDYISELRRAINSSPLPDLIYIGYRKFTGGIESLNWKSESERIHFFDAQTDSGISWVDSYIAKGEYFVWRLVIRRAKTSASFFSRERFYEDMDTAPLLVMNSKKILVLEKVLVGYRYNLNGIMRNPKPEHAVAMERIAKGYANKYDLEHDELKRKRYFLITTRFIHVLWSLEYHTSGFWPASSKMHTRVWEMFGPTDHLKQIIRNSRNFRAREVMTLFLPELKVLNRPRLKIKEYGRGKV